MTYKIYCIEHVDTKRKYIGITGADLGTRWKQHYSDPNSAVYDALRSDGHRMTMTVLEEVATKDEALRIEQTYINQMGTAEPHGWNRQVRTIKPKRKRVWQRVECETMFDTTTCGPDVNILRCPNCGSSFTHVQGAERLANYDHPNYKSYHFDYQYKYGGVIIYFWCENCHGAEQQMSPRPEDARPWFEIVYGDHKGNVLYKAYTYEEVTP